VAQEGGEAPEAARAVDQKLMTVVAARRSLDVKLLRGSQEQVLCFVLACAQRVHSPCFVRGGRSTSTTNQHPAVHSQTDSTEVAHSLQIDKSNQREYNRKSQPPSPRIQCLSSSCHWSQESGGKTDPRCVHGPQPLYHIRPWAPAEECSCQWEKESTARMDRTRTW
jgi:hypothetical protein